MDLYQWAGSFVEKVKKTIRGGVVNLSVVKEGLLDSEFKNFQEVLHGDKGVGLCSALRQRAEMRPLVNAGAPVAVPGTLSNNATSGASSKAASY